MPNASQESNVGRASPSEPGFPGENRRPHDITFQGIHKLVAIHQPNFFPWLGYFHKLHRADVFLVMDNAQFPKTGGTWSNRVRLALGGDAKWVTMPVVRNYHGLRSCREMEIDDSRPWRKQLVKTLSVHYARGPHFAQVFPVIEELLALSTRYLAEFNLHVVRTLAAALGLEPGKMVLGSGLACEGQATDLLIAMVKAVGGTAYLCGGGAGGYQEDEKFRGAGLGLVYQSFQHPSYPQCNTPEFLPGLSILDALFNCGFEGVAAMLKGAPIAGADEHVTGRTAA